MTLTDTRSTRRLLSLAALGSLALTACGTTDVDDADSGDSAQRVVTLEWAQTENVEVLGGNHVGAADLEGYRDWTSAAEIDEDIVDVGTRQEPSIEAIGQADPDLILGTEGSVPDGMLEDLEQIAPVVLQEPADASDPLGHMERTFFETAELLGAEDEADQIWADYEQTLDDARDRLAEAGAAGTPYVVTYPSVEGNTATFRLHGPGAMVSAVGEEIGLTPAWEEAGDEEWAISVIDTEGLTALPEDTEFFWWTASTEPEDPFVPLEDNSTWNSLGFVEHDRMHVIERTWLYGGPGSAMQWTEQLAETVADDA
ncbi:ABC transporter substrate-binding protein [Nesterenkonia suensis]